jgi:hypothetical protein
MFLSFRFERFDAVFVRTVTSKLRTTTSGRPPAALSYSDFVDHSLPALRDRAPARSGIIEQILGIARKTGDHRGDLHTNPSHCSVEQAARMARCKQRQPAGDVAQGEYAIRRRTPLFLPVSGGDDSLGISVSFG